MITETIILAVEIPTTDPKQMFTLKAAIRLLTLKRAHFLRSAKGQKGGYRLAKHPNQIFLADVICLFDGALAPTELVSENCSVARMSLRAAASGEAIPCAGRKAVLLCSQ